MSVEVYFPTCNGELVTYKPNEFHPNLNIIESRWAGTIFIKGGLCSYGYDRSMIDIVINELEKLDSQNKYGFTSHISRLGCYTDYRPPFAALSDELKVQVVKRENGTLYLPRYHIAADGEPLWYEANMDVDLPPIHNDILPREDIGWAFKDGSSSLIADLYPALEAQRELERFRCLPKPINYEMVSSSPLELNQLWQ